jgi:negative regulator of sigma E activity
MLKKILAVVAAAACAAVIVGVIPPPAPADAAKAPQSTAANADQPEVLSVPSACTQGWPNYDQTCLRDARRPNGKARVARVVAIDRPVADRTPRARSNKH